ncbi:acyl carrier protein [Nocardia sp. NPDC056064]|uniref:acyl carrier protein n=1 Tax=Nocardia sp. NPDC056064 TaxID=3345701 RepID=UPI0035D667D0
MNESTVRAAVAAELNTHGYRLGAEEYESDLIGAGVNSVNLVRVLTALEERFDIEFDAARLLSAPMTIAQLAAAIIRGASPKTER